MRTVRLADESFAVADGYDGFWSRADGGRWEPGTFDAIGRCVDRDTVVLDIGAWIGPTVLYAARRARRVEAFEPDPVALAALRENVACNPDVAGRIRIHAHAVWTEAGPRRMGNARARGDSESSLLRPYATDAWTVDCVAAASLDALVEPDAPVFVKMDVEGAEYALLPALGALLERPRIAILVAFHPWTVGTPPRRHATARAASRAALAPYRDFAARSVDRRSLGAVVSAATRRWFLPPNGNVLLVRRR